MFIRQPMALKKIIRPGIANSNPPYSLDDQGNPAENAQTLVTTLNREIFAHLNTLYKGEFPSRSALYANTGYLESCVIVNKGSGYTSPPTLIVSGGGGSGAQLVPVLYNGSIYDVIIVNSGSGYISSPTISVVGGGGSGAIIIAQISGKRFEVGNIVKIATNPPEFLIYKNPLGNLNQAGIPQPTSPSDWELISSGNSNQKLIRVVTTSGPLLASDFGNIVLANANSSNLELQLPDATNFVGQSIFIQKIDNSSNIVKLYCQNSQTIIGQSDFILHNQWQAVELTSNSSYYLITKVI
jgi:hypothetical protein